MSDETTPEAPFASGAARTPTGAPAAAPLTPTAPTTPTPETSPSAPLASPPAERTSSGPTARNGDGAASTSTGPDATGPTSAEPTSAEPTSAEPTSAGGDG